MYAIYTTPGFVIDSRTYGEGGKLLSIFTRDFGLILAVAQGIRLEKSKLRYYTQDYSFGLFSVVKGKEMWRLVSAQDDRLKVKGQSAKGIASHDLRFINKSKSQELVVRLALLLKRLLHGEEAHPELFDCVRECAHFLQSETELSDEHYKTLESVAVFRILFLLGYIGTDTELDAYARSCVFDLEVVASLVGKRLLINQHINKALSESQL